jgi:galactokinase
MKEVAALHKAEYDTAPEIIVQSPGVIKLIGEQTEHCEGLGLAIAASFSVSIAISRRKDATLRFFAADLNERKRTPLLNLRYKREDRWANYLKAPLSFIAEAQGAGSGFSFTISGDIPQGLGFASSTAITLASVLGLKGLLQLNLTNEAVKKLVARSEIEFLGQNFGLLETAAALFANTDTAVLGDIRAQTTRLVPFDLSKYALVITDSRVPRLSIDAEIKLRQGEARRCLALVNAHAARPLAMRDADLEEIGDAIHRFPESSRRRFSFLLEELSRVSDAEEALERKDIQAFGRIMNRSQDGLRDQYEVSCPEIDWLVKRALELDGTICSRLVGKGLGGCTISVMKPEAVQEYQKRLDEYERIFGFKPSVREIKTGERAGIQVS